MPEGVWLFPKEQITTQPERFLAAEITREQLFLALHQELPYQLTVETDSFTESKKDILIHQTIYVARKGHKAIVIGAKGQTLKRVGQRARRTLPGSALRDAGAALPLCQSASRLAGRPQPLSGDGAGIQPG